MIELHIGRQTFDFDCGAKALQTVMAYYGVDVREDELIKELKTTLEGTRSVNVRLVAKSHGFKVKSGVGWTLEGIKRYVNAGTPVIVLLQAWADKFMTIEDWSKGYEYGHYAIVIDNKNEIVVFEDPASFRRTWLAESEFILRWHDRDPKTRRKLEHFGMVLLGKEPAIPTTKHMD
jgi:predicted double-glycine peptidase